MTDAWFSPETARLFSYLSLVVGVVFAGTRRALTRSYSEAELRRTVAADL